MKNIIQHNKMDEYEYKDILDESKKLSKTVKEGSKHLSTADSLSEDMFYSLYKNIVRENETENVESGYEVNKDIMDKVMRTKDYKQLRAGSRLDKMVSALGTVSFMNNTIEEFSEEELEDINDKVNKSQEKQQDIDELKERIMDQKNSDDDNQEKIEEMKKKLEEAKKQQAKQKQKIEDDLQQKSSRIRSVVRKSLRKAKEQSEQMEGMLAGWGMNSAERQSLSWEEKMDLANELEGNQKLQEIAKMIGRMKRLALSVQKQKTNKIPEQTQSIEQGNDLGHVLPSELIHLEEETEMIFYKKYINRELLQYKLEGNEPEAKGPIVCCIDTSSSMQGDREIWAKGISMGLFNIAQRQDRDFHVILFSTTIEYFEIEGKNTSNGEEQRENILKMLKTMLSGGTDFNKPLNKALDIIQGLEDRCDIVFITDGIAKANESIIDRIEDQEELFIAGVGVGDEAGGLDDFSDKIWMIDDIIREGRDTAEDVFELV